jgi:hypothetical protein
MQFVLALLHHKQTFYTMLVAMISRLFFRTVKQTSNYHYTNNNEQEQLNKITNSNYN